MQCMNNMNPTKPTSKRANLNFIALRMVETPSIAIGLIKLYHFQFYSLLQNKTVMLYDKACLYSHIPNFQRTLKIIYIIWYLGVSVKIGNHEKNQSLLVYFVGFIWFNHVMTISATFSCNKHLLKCIMHC